MKNTLNKLHNRAKKLWSTGAFHITLGTFLTKFVAFFGSIVVVRLLTKNEYGLLSYVENIYSYALIFAGFGLSNAILRFLVISEKPEGKKAYYNYITKHSIYRDIALLLGIITLSQIIKFPDKYTAASGLVPIVALLLPFQDLLQEALFTLRSLFKNKLYAYLAFISSSALIIGRIIGALNGGVSGVLWSRVIINAFFCVAIMMLIRKKMLPKETVITTLPKDHKREVNVYSFQYMVTNGFWALFMLNDTFLLGLLLNNPSELADYKVAYVLPGNISIFATAIGVFVTPYFIKNENNQEWIARNFKKIYSLTSLVIATVAGLIGIFAKPLILLMYGEQYINIVTLMRLLLVSSFINSGLRFTCANLLSAMGQVKYNMIVSGIGLIAQVVLDIVLIPRIGVIGVAVASCVTYSFMAASLFIVFRRKYLI